MLAVVLQRFVYDQWVPKKLEIEIQIPNLDEIDFERFRGTNCQGHPGEQIIQDDAQAEGGDEMGEPDLN